MCNSFSAALSLDALRTDWGQTRLPLRFPEGLPNLPHDAAGRITDPALILRAPLPPDAPDDRPDNRPGADAVVRRWSWPGPSGKPVYNYRSEGRDLGNHGAKGGRCLIPVNGFHEFTDPAPGEKRKTRWLFTAASGAAWFCIAGLWRADPKVGEAFTLLTCSPGPDVAPYHARQVVLPDRADWAGWLDGSLSSADVCRPVPAGTLSVRQG